VRPDLIPEEARKFKQPAERDVKGYTGAGDGQGKHSYAHAYAGDLTSLDLLGLFEEVGWLVGNKEDHPCKVICPWHQDQPTGKEEAVVWQSSDDPQNKGWPQFFCHHAHCEGKRLADALAFFGPEKVDAHCSRQWDGGPYPEPADLEKILRQTDPQPEAKETEQDAEAK